MSSNSMKTHNTAEALKLLIEAVGAIATRLPKDEDLDRDRLGGNGEPDNSLRSIDWKLEQARDLLT